MNSVIKHFKNYSDFGFLQIADGDENVQQKRDRRLEMAKKRLANSEVIRDLHREYTDGPEEIRVSFILLLLFIN